MTMPCSACTDSARCDRAGLCQEFAKRQLEQREAHVDCGDCPILMTGCREGHCLRAKPKEDPTRRST